MKFYKEIDGDWILNGEIIPAGTCRQKTESATGRITIKLLGAPASENILALKMLPTDFQDVNGNYYADLAAYELATSDFFVDAALAAAEQLAIDLEAEVQNRTIGDTDLQNQINTVASGYLGAIAYNASAPTPAKNGWYDFSTGGVVSWLTGTPTVKIGDRVSVLYTNPTYIYSYINIDLASIGLVFNSKYNITGQTENLASVFYTADYASKGTSSTNYKGIRLTNITATNFYATLRTKFTGLGLTPFTTGKKYLASFYVLNQNDSEQFIWMRALGTTSSRGHASKLCDGSVRRLWVLCYADTDSTLRVVENPSVAHSSQTASMCWIGKGSNGGDTLLNMYVGGFQIEEIASSSYVDGIALIGDSTMQGSASTYDNMGAREISNYLGGLLNVPVYNRAVGGDTTTQMLARWATDITPISINCKYCLIQGGINDLASSVDTTTIKANITAMYNNAIADNMIPLLLTITPAAIIVGASKESERIVINSWMKSTFPNVFDISAIVADATTPSVLKSVMQSDGTHYNIYAKRAISNSLSKWSILDFITPKPYQQILGNIGTAYTTEYTLDKKIGKIDEIIPISIYSNSNDIYGTGRYPLI